MNTRQAYLDKSRLGRLLVNRGYLSEGQLIQALETQRASGRLLGEVVVASGWLTHRELERVLRQQRRYRRAAAWVAVVTLPLQPVVTLAAVAPDGSEAAPVGQIMNPGRGFQPLSDREMQTAAGQGSDTLKARIEAVANLGQAAQGEEMDAVEGLRLLAHTFVPVLNFLEADVTVSGVHYRSGSPRIRIQQDGGVRLALPERIERISLTDIRVTNGTGPTLGNIGLHDIRFSPDSTMTIYVRD
ncbi:pilus assembly protein PilB [Marinobacter sp. JSM 1782161]|uniref:pilus assembly protein PilB n=1 Tax=Marinobacter sp. JSM 1782161 TaxID=2685906 RepID=UPI001402D0DD|nr:pilus assembly protein PilB [Marinobacter sp. JSM 1782161]